MEWLIVLPAKEMEETTGQGVRVVMEMETNRLLLVNTLIILFQKIMVLHIPRIDHTVGKSSV